MAIAEIFAETDRPRCYRGHGIAGASPWLTWSRASRRLAVALHREGILRRRVALVDVRGCAPYSLTYSLELEKLPPVLRSELIEHAKSLRDWPVGGTLSFFRGLLDPPLSAGGLRVLLAALRAAMVHLDSDPRSALYAPVAPRRRDSGFKLHADLFLTTRLWIIFDDVPIDGSGASLFLSRQSLIRALRSTRSVPREKIQKVETLMTKPIARDSFDRLYGILHGPQRPWNPDLQEMLRNEAEALPMAPGEGYLLDDRCWLHGRSAASSPVSSRRFHRLTFGLRQRK